MAILLDTNILLDFLLMREPYYNAAREIVALARQNKYRFRITPLTLSTTYYMLRKVYGHGKSMLLLQELVNTIPCVSSGDSICGDALFTKMSDFEDALQVAMSKSSCELIITRNVKDFKKADLKAVTPTEFLSVEPKNL
ncbi:MAG: PIN domain-containing protein [Bacteroidia bacterium]|jgi:predicted nucleic acid-binding protein|nr:PIN domain-containing protein [Bacteroidia bacterium]